jgi:DNA mismatch repair protein MutS
MTTEPKLSPMMAQWHACKQQAAGALLFFRLGDFFEAFYEDAEILSKELNLALTKRHEVPMSGLPAHTSEAYIDRLVAKGYRVAVADQVEDARLAKGLVKREIVRIITPGTVINSTLLNEKSNNFLVCLTQLNSSYGLAIVDLTTADFRALQLEDQKEVLDELSRLSPSEIVISNKCFSILENRNYHTHIKEDWFFDHRTALDKLLKHFQVHNLDGFGLKGWNAAINAAGALLTYVEDELGLSVAHLKNFKSERPSLYMGIDETTKSHLELSTLLDHMDHTCTPMGGRLLKQWLARPLLNPEEINKRQDAIATLITHPNVAHQMSSHLSEIRDLERLIMRIETGYASPRDLMSLKLSLEQISPLSDSLQSLSDALIEEEKNKLYGMTALVDKLGMALVETPPLRLSDGGIFKKGYCSELDALQALKTDNHTWIASYQDRLREETHIKTLKVGYTQAFGYYIEVSRGQAQKMPESFQRRQTLVNAERFTTPELNEYEHKILSAEERMRALENQLFVALRQEVAKESQKIRDIADAVGRLDVLWGLAHCAKVYQYVRPLVDGGDTLSIKEGQHPVLAARLSKEKFISNDVDFNQDQRLILITGPNMAGKSTYIRQVALLVIMAQMGVFIPAKAAHIGIVDKIFSRIGASDNLERGQSTFMVEMTETANILNNLSSRSLVILDEIGRGTSTYDGISIAWAVAEFLLSQKERRAKTLFATHYWELTGLQDKIPGAVNYHVAVHEANQHVVFLHKIVKGSTDRSYGIHVGRLAGLPSAVVKRAQEMLGSLEQQRAPSRAPKEVQLDLFNLPPSEHPLLEEIKALDPNRLSPLEALQKIMSWKRQYVI